MTPVELAWLVGLFEGEGCIGVPNPGRLTLQIGMTDADVVERAMSVAGVGTFKVRALRSGKPFYVWTVGRCDEAAALLEKMLPLLGKRRTARAREVLDAYAAAPPLRRLRTHCKHGHPFTRVARWKGRAYQRICGPCQVANTQRCRDRKLARAVA